MKKRIITGVLIAVVLAVIFIINNPLVDTIFIFLISLLGVYEYNKAFKTAGYKLIPIIGYLSCLSVFLIGPNIEVNMILTIASVAISLLVIISFIYSILLKLKVNIIDVALSIFSIIYIPFLFSFLKLILLFENGRLYIWFVILGAFASDTMAFFIGCKFGKRKLCPDVSPKKTIEGSVAGIIGVILSYIIIYIIAKYKLGIQLNLLIVIAMAIVASVVGQFGDLAASSIKRFCKIKDFGTLMPGHGGILDRCDSIMFVAPIVYIIFKIFMFM